MNDRSEEGTVMADGCVGMGTRSELQSVRARFRSCGESDPSSSPERNISSFKLFPKSIG